MCGEVMVLEGMRGDAVRSCCMRWIAGLASILRDLTIKRGLDGRGVMGAALGDGEDGGMNTAVSGKGVTGSTVVAGRDTEADTGTDAETDAGTDAGTDTGARMDVGATKAGALDKGTSCAARAKPGSRLEG